MNLHYTREEMKMLRSKYFKGFKQISYVVYLESRCTGIQWVVLANRELDENITVFYKLKTERVFNRFSDFSGYQTMEEAIGDMKAYDVKSGFLVDEMYDGEHSIQIIYKRVKSVLGSFYTRRIHRGTYEDLN